MPTISLFSSLTDTRPRPYTYERAADLRMLFGYADGAVKTELPLWSPATFRAARRADEVLAVNAAVMDLDDVPVLDIERVIEPFLARHSAVLHSTYTHYKATQKGQVRARAIVDLSRPVRPDEWAVFRQKFGAALGHADTKTADPSRAYFFPGGPAGQQACATWREWRGFPLDVDRLMAEDFAALSRPRARVADLMRSAKSWQRRRNAEQRAMGDALGMLARGEAFAMAGARDDTLFRLLGICVREITGANEDEIKALFARSIDAMSVAQGAPDMDSVIEKYRRLAADKLQSDVVEGNEIDRRRMDLVRRAGLERCYSEAELAQMAAMIGVSRQELDWSWVVQCDTQYWLLAPEGYRGPYSPAALPERAEVVLAPAQTAGVFGSAYDKGVWRRKRPQDLVADHGRVVDGIVLDLAARRSVLEGDQLVLAPCPMRDIRACESSIAAKWLAALGGDDREALLDWLATAHRVDEPNSILYVSGAPNTGKSALAESLARLWTDTGPSELEDALGWSENILRCPLVFGDERVPVDFRGVPRTEDIRSAVTRRTWQIKRKHSQNWSARGCVRIILAANNLNLLSSTGEMGTADVEAIAQRIFYVNAKKDAARILADLTHTERRHLFEHGLPSHVVWLAKNRPVSRKNRFFVDGQGSLFRSALTTGTGARAMICHWLVSWILAPERAAQSARGLLRVRDGQILVSARGLFDMWHLYDVGCPQRPAVSRISAALSGLAHGEQVHLEAAGANAAFYRIDLSHLREWSDRHGFMTMADMSNKVAAMSST